MKLQNRTRSVIGASFVITLAVWSDVVAFKGRAISRGNIYSNDKSHTDMQKNFYFYKEETKNDTA